MVVAGGSVARGFVASGAVVDGVVAGGVEAGGLLAATHGVGLHDGSCRVTAAFPDSCGIV